MAKASTAQRARRLIALLGRGERRRHLARRDGRRGRLVPAELADDLDTLSMCGVAPYTPWELVPVSSRATGSRSSARCPPMRGPVRLSLAEAEALSAALSAAGFSADDPLTASSLRPRAPRSTPRSSRARCAPRPPSTTSASSRRWPRRSATTRPWCSPTSATAPTHRASARSSRCSSSPSAAPGTSRRGAERPATSAPSASTASASLRADRRALRARVRTASQGWARRRSRPRGCRSRGCASRRERATSSASGRARDCSSAAEDGDELVEVPFAGTDWIARRVVARLGQRRGARARRRPRRGRGAGPRGAARVGSARGAAREPLLLLLRALEDRPPRSVPRSAARGASGQRVAVEAEVPDRSACRGSRRR